MGDDRKEISFELNIKPEPAARPRFSFRGTHNSAKYNIYKNTLKHMINFQLESIKPFTEAVNLEVDFVFVKPKSNKNAYHVKRPDLSNLVKAVEDALNASAFLDDAQIVSLKATKTFGPSDKILIKVIKHG